MNGKFRIPWVIEVLRFGNSVGRIIVPINNCTVDSAIGQITKLLAAGVTLFKVGPNIFDAYGCEKVVAYLADRGHPCFYAGNFRNSPRAITKDIGRAAQLGARIISVDCDNTLVGLAAAAQVLSDKEDRPIVVVNVPDGSLHGSGMISARYAGAAMEAGLDGIVVPAQHVSKIRSDYPNLLIIAKGVELDNGSERSATSPAEVVRNGADFLTVSAIATDASPADILEKVVLEMNKGQE